LIKAVAKKVSYNTVSHFHTEIVSTLVKKAFSHVVQLRQRTDGAAARGGDYPYRNFLLCDVRATNRREQAWSEIQAD
jgi:hypothetical protein